MIQVVQLVPISLVQDKDLLCVIGVLDIPCLNRTHLLRLVQLVTEHLNTVLRYSVTSYTSQIVELM